MRYFDYRNQNNVTDIIYYINQLKKELTQLIDIEKNPIYLNSLKVIVDFETKYPNLYEVYDIITTELLSKRNLDAYYSNGKKYIHNASKKGLELEEDLYKIFKLEDNLKIMATAYFKKETTPFNQIKNGEDFMIVGHSSLYPPSVTNYDLCYNDLPTYLSCSLFSNKELNRFRESSNIVYIVDVTADNLICSSYSDVAANESGFLCMHSIKVTDENGIDRYINVGLDNQRNFAVSISTPKVIEKMSIAREVDITGQLYSYDGVLTNEIVLLRKNTSCVNALLIGDETDLMLDDFCFLKSKNFSFKCINIGLYKEKNGIDRINENKLIKLKEGLKSIYQYDPKVLESYYKEVVLEMNYCDNVLSIINDAFSTFVDLNLFDLKNNHIK